MIYRATTETKRFSFEAFGETAQQATDALVAGLCTHGEQYGLPADWWGDGVAQEFDVRAINIGAAGCAFRDGEALALGEDVNADREDDDGDDPCPVNRRPKSTCPDGCDHGEGAGRIDLATAKARAAIRAAADSLTPPRNGEEADARAGLLALLGPNGGAA